MGEDKRKKRKRAKKKEEEGMVDCFCVCVCVCCSVVRYTVVGAGMVHELGVDGATRMMKGRKGMGW